MILEDMERERTPFGDSTQPKKIPLTFENIIFQTYDGIIFALSLLSFLTLLFLQISVSFNLVFSIFCIYFIITRRTGDWVKNLFWQSTINSRGITSIFVSRIFNSCWICIMFLLSLNAMLHLIIVPFHGDDLSDFVFCFLSFLMLVHYEYKFGYNGKTLLLAKNIQYEQTSGEEAYLESEDEEESYDEDDEFFDSDVRAARKKKIHEKIEKYLITTLLVILSITSCFSGLFFLWDSLEGSIVLLTHPPKNMVTTPDGVKLNYWCTPGPLKNNTLVFLQSAYMSPDPSMDLFQRGLSSGFNTKVCSADISGVGWSQSEPHGKKLGFSNDARNMKIIINRILFHHHQQQQEEDDEGSMDLRERKKHTIILGGHSRGAVTAQTFKWLFEGEYENIIGLSIDGSSCVAQSDSLTKRFVGLTENEVTYLLGSFSSLWRGILRFLMHIPQLNYLANTNTQVENPIRITERLYHPWYWKSAARRSSAWIGDQYDGPTIEQCKKFRDENSWFDVFAYNYFENGTVAEHRTIISREAYVDAVIHDFMLYLKHNTTLRN